MATTNKPEPVKATALAPGAYKELAGLLTEVPTGEDEDATERIIEQILGVESVDQLADAWSTADWADLVGKELVVDEVTKRPSEVGALGIFLVVKGHHVKTGEMVTLTTGATAAVAQLAKAHSLGAIPGLLVIPREVQTSTGNTVRRFDIVKPL